MKSPNRWRTKIPATVIKTVEVSCTQETEFRIFTLIAKEVVWHYFNPNLPDLSGYYVGLAGVGAFVEAVGKKSRGTFKVEPQSVTPVGDELVVRRIVDCKVREVWDIVPGSAEEIRVDVA